MNFERDDASGELFSAELAIAEHQEASAQEAEQHAEVAAALDPAARHDWLAFFSRECLLQPAYELWQGETFLRNEPALPSRLPRGVCALPVFSLLRCSFGGFEAAAAASGSWGGAAVVFRLGSAAEQPFGMWFSWLRCSASLRASGAQQAQLQAQQLAHPLLLLDLQNGVVSESLAAAVGLLQWEEGHREEVFWAPYRG
jgi:hypothetical protein